MASRLSRAISQSSATQAARTVTIVDDDRVFCSTLRSALTLDGWSSSVMSVADAVEASVLGRQEVVLLEPCPRGLLDLRLLSIVVSDWRPARIFVVTNYPSLAVGMACVRAGVDDCYAKPIDSEQVVRLLNGGDAPRRAGQQQRQSLSLARVQHEFIAQTLREYNWNISVAARMLGIRRSTLQRKLRKIPPSASSGGASDEAPDEHRPVAETPRSSRSPRSPEAALDGVSPGWREPCER